MTKKGGSERGRPSSLRPHIIIQYLLLENNLPILPFVYHLINIVPLVTYFELCVYELSFFLPQAGIVIVCTCESMSRVGWSESMRDS